LANNAAFDSENAKCHFEKRRSLLESIPMQSNETQPTVPTSRAADIYGQHIRSLEAQIRDRMSAMQRLVWIRIGLALPGLALIVFGVVEKTAGSWTWQTGIGLFVGFLIAATWHENNLWATAQLRQRLYGYRRLWARCERDWSNLPALPTEDCCKAYQSELSRDLDLFGDRSLFRWHSLAMTNAGAKTACEWMMNWADTSTLAQRQSAVRELAANRPWREEFFETTCNFQNQQAGPDGIVEWSKQPPHFQKRRWIQWLTWISPITLVLGFVLIIASKLAENSTGQVVGLICILGCAALNFLMTMLILGPIHDIFVKIGAANRELQSLLDMIRSIKKLNSKEQLLVEVRSKCFDSEHSADIALGQIQRIMALAGMQRSPIMFLLYLILQVLFLWDVRVLELLEGWKKRYSDKTAGWLHSIAVVECLCSSSAIADEYPHWTYPQWTSKSSSQADAPVLDVQGISHPLLKDSHRVPNDLTIQRNKPLLLVTGSNMAGKSTLLRSVGVNSILARLGAPVCAKQWKGDSCELASSIRVQDSLQDGVSFFMAELKRLRSVVDSAQRENHNHGKQMLVLLDEILQGTNSRERQIAVEHVLDRLVECGCIVLSSTHDLEMAGNQGIQRIAQVVHFREHFEEVDGKQVMRFDYLMHPGVTPTTNALKLLEMVGLRTGQD
jgi:predicted ATPase